MTDISEAQKAIAEANREADRACLEEIRAGAEEARAGVGRDQYWADSGWADNATDYETLKETI